jgi:hypothetical protein
VATRRMNPKISFKFCAADKIAPTGSVKESCRNAPFRFPRDRLRKVAAPFCHRLLPARSGPADDKGTRRQNNGRPIRCAGQATAAAPLAVADPVEAVGYGHRGADGVEWRKGGSSDRRSRNWVGRPHAADSANYRFPTLPLGTDFADRWLGGRTGRCR